MPYSYANIVFTLNKISITLGYIISTLIDEGTKKVSIEEEIVMFVKNKQFLDSSIIHISLLFQEIKDLFAIIVNN